MTELQRANRTERWLWVAFAIVLAVVVFFAGMTLEQTLAEKSMRTQQFAWTEEIVNMVAYLSDEMDLRATELGKVHAEVEWITVKLEAMDR